MSNPSNIGREQQRRTFVDVLRQGQREQFHSAMIAWFLDPKAEHGFGDRFLRLFAERIPERAKPARSILLENFDFTIHTEKRGTGGRRYDIVISAGDESKVVFENKTKSIGTLGQLERYGHVIPLGLCEACYHRDTRDKYPVMTYQDVLDVLDELSCAHTEWGFLVNQYRTFLRRELSLLQSVRDCYESGHHEQHNKITEALNNTSIYGTNDIRFLHHVMLFFFQIYLDRDDVWQGAEWSLDKNQQSGVWLALNKQMPPGFRFLQAMQEAIDDTGAYLWFHIELNEGLKAHCLNDTAGQIQLRSNTNGRSPAEIHSRFKEAYQRGEGEEWSRKPRKNCKTFYLVRRYLKKSDLVFSRLEGALKSFMERFGSFEPQ